MRFLDRIPNNLGSELVSITKQDHYMEVITKQGSKTLHMKMADAVAELKNYPGLQIHRSHWVASDEILTLKRQGRKTFALLKDGRALPVSTTFKEPLVSLIGAK